MIFIAVIFLVLIGIFIYIYAGLRFSESVTNDDLAYTLFWAAYIFLGVTIAICIGLVFIWGDLYKKVGPPGARGIMGDDGDEGLPGTCNASHSILSIMYSVREMIQDKAGKDNPVITEDGQLVNVFMESRLETIAGSNQLKLLLESANTTNNNPVHTVYKSLKDITGYITGIWNTWTTGILADSHGLEFFKTAEALPDISEGVQAFFTNEIEKYDIWYWGSTQLFRPLEAEVCRRAVIPDAKGVLDEDVRPRMAALVQNANLPQPDNAALDIIEIEYSDFDVSKLTKLYDTAGIAPGNPKRAKKWLSTTNTTAGLISQPAFYIPKLVTRDGRKYYPIGQVIIETNPAYQDKTIKKTIMVSGDIIIPTGLKLVWFDSASSGVERGCFYKLETTAPGYICAGDLFINSTVIMSPAKNKKAVAPSINEVMLSLGYDMNKGVIIGDSYKGIVCIPGKCAEKLERSALPSWKYESAGIVFESENPTETYNIARVGEYTNNTSEDTISTDSFYKITGKCTLDLSDIPVKKLEAAFEDLGIGWFGTPAKQGRQYSIFSFIGLMPEGIVVHRPSGNKYYVRHYGGSDVNKYLLVRWDSDEKEFIQTLKATSPDSVIIEKGVVPTDKAQQWSMHPDPANKSYFRLKSVAYPNKYLSLDYSVKPGWNQTSATEDNSLAKLRPGSIGLKNQVVRPKLVFAAGPVNASNNTIFYNVPAYGA